MILKFSSSTASDLQAVLCWAHPQITQARFIKYTQ